MQSWPLAQSAVRRHWTQAPALQTGVAVGQSVSARQSTQTSSVAQNFPVAPAQSPLAWHSTQVEVVGLQTGVLLEHIAESVQPAMQVKLTGLQIGFAAPQSALSRHGTQRPAGSQRGALAAQSASVAQATQLSVALLQILLVPVQSVDAWQPTQAPAATSQVGVAFGQSVSPVQAV
jgi:hypothetical protein